MTIHGRRQDEFAAVGQHGAPFRRRRLGAKTEEAEACRLENCIGDAERRLDDQGCQAIGEHGDKHQAQLADAGDAGGGDIVARQLRQRRGPDQADIAGKIDDGHRDDGVGEVRPDHCDDENGEHQRRDRHDEIHDPQDDDVDDAAEGRRGKPQRHADHGRDHHTARPMNNEMRAP